MFVRSAFRAARLAAPRVVQKMPAARRVAFTTGAGLALTTTAVVTRAAVSNTVFAGGADYNQIRKDIASILEQESYDDGSVGPLLVRLAWHSSGTYSIHDKTGGSGGATMRFYPEAGHGANAGLAVARGIMEKIKERHPACSYADLYTLAGAVAIEEMGGPAIPWRPGRSDAPDATACTPDGRLPDAAQGAAHLREIFNRMGFNDQEIVALNGAHGIGRCHTDRSGFSGPWTNSPTTFSNAFYTEVLHNTWTPKEWSGPKQFADPTGKLMMLPTDLAFRDDPEFRKHAEAYAKDEKLFFKDFAAAFGKMMELGVKFPESSSTPKVLIGTLSFLALAGGAALPWPFPK